MRSVKSVVDVEVDAESSLSDNSGLAIHHSIEIANNDILSY